MTLKYFGKYFKKLGIKKKIMIFHKDNIIVHFRIKKSRTEFKFPNLRELSLSQTEKNNT